jgi:hypothetical protein
VGRRKFDLADGIVARHELHYGRGMSTDDDRREFAAPWGGLLKVTSLLLVVVLSGATIAGLMYLPSQAPRLCRWILGTMCPAILLATVPFIVRGYTIHEGGLRVHRLFWDTRISWMGLKAVEVNPDAMRGSLRLLGNGGGFVFVGWFRNRELGLYRAYVNDLNRAVVLRFPGQTIVVSPDDPAAFAAAVTKQAKALGCFAE